LKYEVKNPYSNVLQNIGINIDQNFHTEESACLKCTSAIMQGNEIEAYR